MSSDPNNLISPTVPTKKEFQDLISRAIDALEIFLKSGPYGDKTIILPCGTEYSYLVDSIDFQRKFNSTKCKD